MISEIAMIPRLLDHGYRKLVTCRYNEKSYQLLINIKFKNEHRFILLVDHLPTPAKIVYLRDNFSLGPFSRILIQIQTNQEHFIHFHCLEREDVTVRFEEESIYLSQMGTPLTVSIHPYGLRIYYVRYQCRENIEIL